jgi:hypothetical protein
MESCRAVRIWGLGQQFETQSRFGRSARNCRLTLSSGHGALLSRIVVRITLPCIKPRSPSRRINLRHQHLIAAHSSATPLRVSAKRDTSSIC